MRSVGMTVALSRGTVMCPQCGGATVLIIRSGERARTAVSRFGCVTAVSIWMRVGVHRATAFLSTASSTVHARWIGAPRESRAASGEASAGAASHAVHAGSIAAARCVSVHGNAMPYLRPYVTNSIRYPCSSRKANYSSRCSTCTCALHADFD